jgi:energy-coupling factor transporter ATP-binding protein EcfA2
MACDGPRVLLLDEPTKGIDVGSKAAVHRFMSELVSQGLAVVMVSSELPEILGMSDRIVVMARGRLRRIFTRAEATRRPSCRSRPMREGPRSARFRLSKHRDVLLGFLVVALAGATAIAYPGFITPGNLAGIVDDTAILIILALAQMLVILTRGDRPLRRRQSGAHRDAGRDAECLVARGRHRADPGAFRPDRGRARVHQRAPRVAARDPLDRRDPSARCRSIAA